jgi:cystathionine beta-synthase
MDAEAQGRVKQGDTLIEATSGNTGIGLSLASAVKGYKCIITLPQKMSAEKVNTMKALGSEIIRTPTEAAYDSPESHISVAKRLNGELPNSHILDQYRNPSNIQAHYDGTAYEIFEQTQGRLDAIVIGAGTGGTITGVGRRLKELIPGILVVGVDPHGSILACDTDPIASNVVEGIGYDFIPDTLDRSVVDKWVKTGDKEAFLMARRLIREEGLLCGGSCGSAMLGAVAVAKELGPGKRVAVILPDSIRNYMSKHLVDEWMADRGYLDPVDPAAPDATTGPMSPGKDSQRKEQESIANQVSMNQTQISELKLAHPITTTIDSSIHEAIQIMRSSSIDQLPIVSATGELQGLVSLDGLMKAVVSGLHTQGLKAIKSCDYGELHMCEEALFSLLCSLLSSFQSIFRVVRL